VIPDGLNHSWETLCEHSEFCHNHVPSIPFLVVHHSPFASQVHLSPPLLLYKFHNFTPQIFVDFGSEWKILDPDPEIFPTFIPIKSLSVKDRHSIEVHSPLPQHKQPISILIYFGKMERLLFVIPLSIKIILEKDILNVESFNWMMEESSDHFLFQIICVLRRNPSMSVKNRLRLQRRFNPRNHLVKECSSSPPIILHLVPMYLPSSSSNISKSLSHPLNINQRFH